MDNKSARVISISNQKGGVGKTTTAVNLSACLTQLGNKVLLIDFDPQANTTMHLGFHKPDELSITIYDVLKQAISDDELLSSADYIMHSQGIDFISSNVDLAMMEATIVNAMCREVILKRILAPLKEKYDFIIIDTMPSLGLLTINAYAASDSIIIPVGADDFYSAKGLESLIRTILNVRKQINSNLTIDGVLITKLNLRTSFSKILYEGIENSYGDIIKIFDSKIPISTKVSEMSSEGKTILNYDPKGKVATAYMDLAREVIQNG